MEGVEISQLRLDNLSLILRCTEKLSEDTNQKGKGEISYNASGVKFEFVLI